MRMQLVLGLGAALAAAGCAGRYTEPQLPQNHPANAAAAVAPARTSSRVLDLSGATPIAEAQAATLPGGTVEPTTAGSGGHAGHGATEVATYTCPMHPEVVSSEPGRCPHCGMNLVEKEPGR